MKLLQFVKVSALLLAINLVFATSARSAPGDVDTTFGTGGRVFTNIAIYNPAPEPPYYPIVSRTLVQPDGKILVCGSYWEDEVSDYFGGFVLRYMPDGSLDSTFGEVGLLRFGNTYLFDIAIQLDGKILLIGSAFRHTVVRRLTTSGTVDSTFGNNGVTTVPGSGFGEGYNVRLQPDGKIVGVGNEFGIYRSVLFRLNTDGRFDSSFGQAGTGVVYSQTFGFDQGLVLSDGKILVMGTGVLARYNPNGTLDATFGTNGVLTHQLYGLWPIFTHSTLQPDGKIVAVGYAVDDSDFYYHFIVRYNADGSFDSGFGSNGVLNVDPLFILPTAVIAKLDGTIMVVGFERATPARFAAIRLMPNGELDSGFGVGGRSLIKMNAGGSNNAIPFTGAIQADGKIVLAGFFAGYFSDSHEYVALTRVDGGASPPAVLVSVSGRVLTPNGRGVASSRVTIIDEVGNTRYTQTNPFGYYRFLAVTAGLNYSVKAYSKRHTFTNSIYRVFPTGSLTNLDFISDP